MAGGARKKAQLIAWGRTQGLNEWAREKNCIAATIRLRLAKGWTLEDALTVPTQRRYGGRKPEIHLTARGETRSLVEWSELTGIPLTTLRSRHADGHDAEAILKTERLNKSQKAAK